MSTSLAPACRTWPPCSLGVRWGNQTADTSLPGTASWKLAPLTDCTFITLLRTELEVALVIPKFQG